MTTRSAPARRWAMVAIVCSVATTGLAAGPASIAPAGTPGHVAQFLADLQKVQNAEQAAALLRRANLNDSELAQAAEELRKPSWTAKLDAIKQSARPAPHPPTPAKYRGQTTQKVVADLRTSLERETAGRQATVKQGLQARLSAARSAAGPMRTHSERVVAGAAASNPYAADPAAAASIDSISPDDHVEVGDVVTVNGRRFGSTPGRVVVRTPIEIFNCEVQSWSETRISVSIPRSICPWESMLDVPANFHEEPRSGSGPGYVGNRFVNANRTTEHVWVKLAGGEAGPWREIAVGAEVARLTPTISAVTPAELEPGSELLIEGRNLGDESNPGTSWVKLYAEFSGRLITLRATEWRDSYILARVPEDISGVQAMRGGILKVFNRLGLATVKGGLSFTPEMDVQDIERGPFFAMCEPRNFPLLCLFGETELYPAYDLQLQNGWTVHDPWIEVVESHSQGANYGGYFERTPEIGSTSVQTKVAAWADAYSMVECLAHVIVRGPKGTSFR